MIDQVRPADLNDWFSRVGVVGEPPPLLLDVREPAEWQVASVSAEDGFSVLKISMGELPARLAELDAARPVACLCHHGARSQRVAAFLAHNGFEHVANVAGGIDAWSLERDGRVPRY